MTVQYIQLLPIGIFIWSLLTFLTSYIIAVVRKDAYPIFPYISDTGTFSPESCIFGQMLNMGSIFMALFYYIRFKAVHDICIRNGLSNEIILSRNSTSLYYGLLSAFGIMIVGNFQETNILVVHFIGAFLAFGLGNIWQFYQTWISFTLYPTVGQKYTNNVRLVLTIISWISGSVSFLFGLLWLTNFKGTNMAKWNEQDEIYNYHLVSSITEWIISLSALFYILTFTSEFKQITVGPIEVSVNVMLIVNVHSAHTAQNPRQHDRIVWYSGGKEIPIIESLKF